MATQNYKYNALKKAELNTISDISAIKTRKVENIRYLKIRGVSDFWDKNNFNEVQLGVDTFSSVASYKFPFVYVILGSNKGINLYIGTTYNHLESLKTTYKALYPGIDIEICEDDVLHNVELNFGGIFTGLPTYKCDTENGDVLQIESIIRGMLGKKFAYVVYSEGISDVLITQAHEQIFDELADSFSRINQSISSGAMANISSQAQDFRAQDYHDNLKILEESINEGIASGMWSVTGLFACNNYQDAIKLSNIIKGSYSGADSKPEPFRTIMCQNIKNIVSNLSVITEETDNKEHPLFEIELKPQGSRYTLYNYKYQTIMNSKQLSVLCQLPEKEFPGYYIDNYVEFDVSNRLLDSYKDPFEIGEIVVAGRVNNDYLDNKYYIEKNDLTRHALIIGITGGGKTNTSKSILKKLWVDTDEKIPFLVIESAKREYWELRNIKGFEDLLVFTLGSETKNGSVPYRINPFECNPKVSLQTHIDYLLSTFKAAFDLYAPMPYVLEKAVYAIYEDKGWDIVENINRYGINYYPTLSDLYNKIEVIVKQLGYYTEIESNVKAALQARIYSLMIGGKGSMLNTPKSTPIGELLNSPVIMELEDIGDDDTKAFVIGILLVQLYEYRKSQMKMGSKDLSHLLLVEEAHRLLKNVQEGPSEGDNSRAKSVEFFCNMLAEIRTYGQGIFVADQIPTKLAPDTIKNTNLKIVHRTVAMDDRETIGKAMNMNEEQIDYLSSLPRGYAAVYSEGDDQPKCVKMPLVKSDYSFSREEVIVNVKKRLRANEKLDTYNLHAGCKFCKCRCRFFERVGKCFSKHHQNPAVLGKVMKNHDFNVRNIDSILFCSVFSDMEPQTLSVLACELGYILSSMDDIDDDTKNEIVRNYIESKGKN